jgi:glyoxylase-like metal-dependent hydrolase (beta-lactamase superfamily II)
MAASATDPVVGRIEATAMNVRRFALFAVASTIALGLVACATPPAPNAVRRMIVLYCGEAQIPDISPWSPGFNVGRPMTFSDNCYLIRHGDTWMLWDSGFSDELAKTPEGVVGARSMRQLRSVTLASQLVQVGVAPADIRIVAFSHTHGDHVGNSRLFPTAKLYIQQAESTRPSGRSRRSTASRRRPTRR